MIDELGSQIREAARRRLGRSERSVGALVSALAELGAGGLEVPEADGGSGRSFVDACAVIRAAAEHALPSTAVSLLGAGLGAVLVDPDGRRRAERLRSVMAGASTAVAALTGDDGTRDSAVVTATPHGDGFVLRGSAGFVADAEDCDLIAVAAARPGSAVPDCLFEVSRRTPGLHYERQPTVDPAQHLGRLVFDDVTVAAAAALAPPGAGTAVVEHLRDRAAVAGAADSVGSAERCVELVVAHLTRRHQFGRPLGSFQALKHRCASMYVSLRFAQAAVEHAAAVIDDPGQAAAAASIAKSEAGERCAHIAAEAVQLHGAMGFSAEHELHLHLKRQHLDAALYGDPSWHRRRLGRLALDPLRQAQSP